MTVFITVVAGLLLAVLAVLLMPLLRAHAARTLVEREDANLQILRDQLAELDGDLRSGVLSSEQYDSARAELERRAIEESREATSVADGTAGGRRWLTPAVIALLVPVASAVLYARLGSTDGLDVEAWMQQQTAEITPEKIEQMMAMLEQHLEENPGDVEGWGMLGRAYKGMQRFDDSAIAWARAAALAPEDADVLTEYAEALGLAAGGDLSGEPTKVLARALAVTPTHVKALALSGGAAFSRGDYAQAIEHWRKLLAVSGDDRELVEALNAGIAEAESRMAKSEDQSAPLEAAQVSGTVSLSPQLAQGVAADDTVFIFARTANGPGMPLAVARVKVSELPYAFRLDDSMAIMPERKMSDFDRLVVGARISKGANAARRSGDLEGFSSPVAVTASDVRVVIDQRVP